MGRLNDLTHPSVLHMDVFMQLQHGRGIGLIRNRKDNLDMSVFQVEIGKEWFALKKFVVPAKAGI